MPADFFNILINARSGTVLAMGRPAIEAAIEASELPVAELCFSEPGDMQTNLDRLSRDRAHLIIGGGDGTIRETARYLSAGNRKAFGILPFGTMNLLANDLGIGTLDAALAAYTRRATEDAVDAGYVNGELFLCCASIGAMPEASVYREERRSRNKWLLLPEMFMFVLNSLDRRKREKVVLEIDGFLYKYRSASVVVSNNRFKDSVNLNESNFLRATLKDGELAAYIATTKTRTSQFRFLSRLLFGNWLNDPDLVELFGRDIKLWSKHKRELVSIDGEVLELRTPLHFSIRPGAINLLVPA